MASTPSQIRPTAKSHQPAGWWIVQTQPTKRTGAAAVRNPTNAVGDRSYQPTEGSAAARPESPNRQVGDISRQPTASERRRLSPVIPQPAGWGYFTPAYNGPARDLSGNSPTGRLGIFHASLQADGPTTFRNPQPAGWGYFTPAYNERPHSPLIPQPAGWGYFTPAYSRTAAGWEFPERLGISSRQLYPNRLATLRSIPNLQVGDITVSGYVAGRSTVGWREISPTCRLGDYRRGGRPFRCRLA